MAAKDPYLIPSANPARYGDGRRRRHLFLPKYLRTASGDQRLQDDAQERAYGILCKWADLEARGRLANRTESTLKPEFLTQVFGLALGYALFSQNAPEWHLEPEFPTDAGPADAALGVFCTGRTLVPAALVEVKGPTTNLDRDRPAGRTAIQQCWDYLNAVPECPWGIVSNYVSFRLYHRGQTPRAYELFTLQDLRRPETFREFYYLFERRGLLPGPAGRRARADVLLEQTAHRQREVGDDLYKRYDQNRRALVNHLRGKPYEKSLDQAIHIAQKLLDRIIFVAFCEDRGLLPENALERTHDVLTPFTRVTNPRWQNFLELFRSIDVGDAAGTIPPYDGNLFHRDDEVDNLQLDDEWTHFFKEVGAYDFRDEVNLEVLGHLFQKSVEDIEQLRRPGALETESEPAIQPGMQKSAERKRFGIYYTPPGLTQLIVEATVAAVAQERLYEEAARSRLTPAERHADVLNPRLAEYWRKCLAALRTIKVVDPACGSGAFLIQAYEALDQKYEDIVDHLVACEGPKAEEIRDQIPDFILFDNLFGVDLSPQAVGITQLALWIRSAREDRTLCDLSHNIVCGNSLVGDPAVHPRALDWRLTFPQAFMRESPGFDCVIGNPPWERLKLQEREFFNRADPRIATAVSAATRRRLIAELETTNPDLHAAYVAAKQAADGTLDYVRSSGHFPLTGKGDINTYAVFAELAHDIVSPFGRVGLLVPSGIATDHTTGPFFRHLVGSKRLRMVYDFENRDRLFPDIDGRFKFSVFVFGGTERPCETADFAFFLHQVDDLKTKRRHVSLSHRDLKTLNPNTQTCPIFRSRRDVDLTKAVYGRVRILIDHNRQQGGNPWGVKFVRMFDQTNDAEFFQTAAELQVEGFRRDGSQWHKRKRRFLPLYEAKMVQMYDHRAAGVVVRGRNWMRQGQKIETPLAGHQNAEFTPEARWWVDEKAILGAIGTRIEKGFIGFKDITSSTNTRTVIASAIPWSGVTNHFPLLLTDCGTRLSMCLLANLDSFVLDYVARQKLGAVTLNFFIVEQFPLFPPDFYEKRCPWDSRQTLEKWVSERALKLTCTANDMRPLAEAAGFDPPVHQWDPAERADLMAELDAAYFLLYGLDRDDAAYILSTFSGVATDVDPLLGGSTTFDRILTHYGRLRERSGP